MKDKVLIKQCEFNSKYDIYSDGKVFSRHYGGGFLKPILTNGAHYVNISHPDLGHRKSWIINRLVFHHFVEKINLLDFEVVIEPIDGNPFNHDYKNLRLISKKKQMNKSIHNKGITSGTLRSKVAGKEKEIARKYFKENATLNDLAIEYDVSDMSIHRAIRRHKKSIKSK